MKQTNKFSIRFKVAFDAYF